MRTYFGIALVTVLAVGCGGEVGPSPVEPNGLGTQEQGVSATFNGCTFSTAVPTQVSPSIYPEWNSDVDVTGSFQCDTAGTYGATHNIQVWNTQWNDWDNYHIWGGGTSNLNPGDTVTIDNRNWLEPKCYRASMSIAKFDANRNRIWTSPTIFSGMVSLGAPCPDGSSPPPPSSFALTLTATGRTGEKVTSTPANLIVNVGTTGSANFSGGTSVKLTASNGRSAIWSGACSSASAKTPSCTFTLNAASAVTANIQ